jgi:hypothetical protein
MKDNVSNNQGFSSPSDGGFSSDNQFDFINAQESSPTPAEPTSRHSPQFHF